MDHEESLFAFVLMPFSEKYKDVYLLGIKAAAEKVGVRAERVDDQIYTEGMLEQIFNQIDLADIIVADLSEKNPNVYFEIGYAIAKGKLCLLVTASSEDIPFDLKHKRHIVYGGSISTLLAHLTRDLEWAKTKIYREKIARRVTTPPDMTEHIDAKPTTEIFSSNASSEVDKTNKISEVKVPTLPESIDDALITKWHVKAGDRVSRDDSLVDIETDKVVMEVPCAIDGIVSSILRREGDTVKAHEIIGSITEK